MTSIKKTRMIAIQCMNILFLFLPIAHAYDASLLNCSAPSSLQSPALELSIQHRFSRVLFKKSQFSFFDAANVALQTKAQVYRGFDATWDYFISNNELDYGIGYSQSFLFSRLNAAAQLHYFVYDTIKNASRKSGLFYLIALEFQPLKNRLSLFYNGGYSTTLQSFNSAVALLISAHEKIDFVGEYFFSNNNTLKKTFAFGIKINTFAHHFKIIITNNTESGFRRCSSGSLSNELRFGFSVQRLFEL